MLEGYCVFDASLPCRSGCQSLPSERDRMHVERPRHATLTDRAVAANCLTTLYLLIMAGRTWATDSNLLQDQLKMSEATGLKLNTAPTPTIADDAIRQLTMQKDGARLAGPLIPGDLLKARLPQRPRVFVLVPAASVGDVGPFMRLVHVCNPAGPLQSRPLTQSLGSHPDAAGGVRHPPC